MALVLTNNASALLSGSINRVVTSLAVGSGTGSLFPALSGDDWFPVVVRAPDGSMEIMRATARTGDVITVTRGQEGSSARSFTAGARVDCRLTEAAIAGIITDLSTYADAAADAAEAAAIADLEVKLSAPSGFKMSTPDAAAPDGWTINTDNDDAAARIVSGSPSTGGTKTFSTAFAARTIAKANLPSYNLGHSLTFSGRGTDTVTHLKQQNGRLPSSSRAGRYGVFGTKNERVTINISGRVKGSIALGGSGTAMDFAVKYVDFIIIEKD